MLLLVGLLGLNFHTQLLGNTTAGDIFTHVLLKDGVEVGFGHHGPRTRAFGLLGEFGAKAVQIELAILCLGASL